MSSAPIRPIDDPLLTLVRSGEVHVPEGALTSNPEEELARPSGAEWFGAFLAVATMMLLLLSIPPTTTPFVPSPDSQAKTAVTTADDLQEQMSRVDRVAVLP